MKKNLIIFKENLETDRKNAHNIIFYIKSTLC